MQKTYKNLIIVAILVLAWSAEALVVTLPGDLTLSFSPKSPRASGIFAAEAKSFAFDTVRANFTWFVNGKQVASGVGLKEQEFTAGKLGSLMTIRVVANSEDGLTYEAQAALAISDIDFIVNSLTYTPAFYRGAALPTPGSTIEIFAVPHLFRGGSRLSAQNLIYEWSLDNKPVLNQSGGGKNILTIDLADVGGSNYTVGLKISTSDSSLTSEKTISLKTYQPEVLFYEVSSLMGVRPLASNSFSVRAGNPFSVVAEPYYLSLNSIKSAKVEWRADGKIISQPTGGEALENPWLLELTSPADSESQSVLSFKFEDARKIFQRAGATLQITATQ